jgi:hypothetical protein
MVRVTPAATNTIQKLTCRRNLQSGDSGLPCLLPTPPRRCTATRIQNARRGDRLPQSCLTGLVGQWPARPQSDSLWSPGAPDPARAQLMLTRTDLQGEGADLLVVVCSPLAAGQWVRPPVAKRGGESICLPAVCPRCTRPRVAAQSLTLPAETRAHRDNQWQCRHLTADCGLRLSVLTWLHP